MREISLNDFLECYKPTCNECTPYPENLLTILMGKVIWDKRDYSRIASNLTSKTIWTIFEDDSSYYIVPAITQSMSSNLVGYIVCSIPYHSNDISNVKLVINKIE